MKTKTLLLTTLLALAGSASLLAQSNVYSLNVVGYVNVPVLANKFQLISNPLKNGANNLNTILATNVPDGTLIYKFVGGGFPGSSVFIEGFGWDPDATLNPGEGAFVNCPNNTNLTFVGEVVTGSTNPIPAGFSLKGSVVPQSTNLTALKFPAGDGDLIYKFNASSQAYLPSTSFIDGFGWDGVEGTNGPSISVGESVFVFRQPSNGSTNWVRNFVIQ